MPAFGDVLSAEEIDAAVRHIRTFCRSASWPRGNLNLPRPLVTEKAFPENEAVMTTSVEGADSVGNVFVYEHRTGARSQYEVVVPFNLRKGETSGWARGLGDVAVATKRALFDTLATGSILSAGGEVTFPTASRRSRRSSRLPPAPRRGACRRRRPRWRSSGPRRPVGR